MIKIDEQNTRHILATLKIDSVKHQTATLKDKWAINIIKDH